MILPYIYLMVSISYTYRITSADSAQVATHRFNAEEADWGFTRFAELRRLFHMGFEGRGTPLVQNDEAMVTAYVRIVKDPTGVLWHSFQKYVTMLSYWPFLNTLSNKRLKLRLKERNRYGRSAKPGRDMLSELPTSVIVFYKRI